MGFAWEISIQGLVIVNPIDQYLTCNLGTKAKHIYIRSAVDTCKVSKKDGAFCKSMSRIRSIEAIIPVLPSLQY